jgi:hypothetical protein
MSLYIATPKEFIDKQNKLVEKEYEEILKIAEPIITNDIANSFKFKYTYLIYFKQYNKHALKSMFKHILKPFEEKGWYFYVYIDSDSYDYKIINNSILNSFLYNYKFITVNCASDPKQLYYFLDTVYVTDFL